MEESRKFTRNLMAKFPSWMKMSKDPNSIGAKFLDVFGITLQEFEEEMDYVVSNFYAKTADVDMIDILYKVPVTKEVVPDFSVNPPHVEIMEHNNIETSVKVVERVRHLYSRKISQPTALFNRQDGYLYLRLNMKNIKDKESPFKYIKIDDTEHYKIEYHHVWNAFDEFGFLLGLKRLPLESNKSYKERILDVFKNPGSSTKKGIQSGLSRELGLNKKDIDIFSLNEKAYNKELVKENGAPTNKMKNYARKINQNLKFTIDTLNLGEAYWYSLEEENIGLYFLPHIWDIDNTLFETKEFQSGVGFGDDLKVNKPKVNESTLRSFNMNVSLVGYYEDYEEFYPEIIFDYKIYAKGKLLENNYKEEPFKYTLIAAEKFEQDYTLVASQDFTYMHQVLFDNKNNFSQTEELEYLNFTKSNVFLNKQTDNLLRLSWYFNTTNPYESVNISNMRVYWEDTSGKTHTYVYDTRDKWINPQTNNFGQPTSTPVTNGTYYDEVKNVFELGRGNFKENIKTSADFMQGNYDTNFINIQNGTIKLNFDSINQIGD